MNARDKARLRRIVSVNADAYREQRRRLVLAVMRGENGAPCVNEHGRVMIFHAQMIAESMADLLAHADPKSEETP